MDCIICGKNIPEGSLFCNFCGAKQEFSCPSCGASLPAGSAFCNKCGARVGGAMPAPEKEEEFGNPDISDTLMKLSNLTMDDFVIDEHDPQEYNKNGGAVQSAVQHEPVMNYDDFEMTFSDLTMDDFVIEDDFEIENGILKKYNGSSSDVIIPDGVTTIGLCAFHGCTSLTSMTVPNSVTMIDASAFFGCTSLKSVTIPDSVTNIAFRTFYNCTSLTNVTIPDSVAEIDSCAFENCTSLTNMIIPNSVTSFAGDLFKGCTSLESVTISNSIVSIGGSSFSGLPSLKSVIIPDSVKKIDREAFNDCPSLDSETLAKIDKIRANEKLKDFSIWSGKLTRYLGNDEHVEIPYGVTKIAGDYENWREKYSSPFEDKPIKSVTIPDSVTEIGESAFDGCTSLESVTIPQSVTTISNSAFNNCVSLDDKTLQRIMDINPNLKEDILHLKKMRQFKKHFGNIKLIRKRRDMSYEHSKTIKEGCGDHLANKYETPRPSWQLMEEECLSLYETEKFGGINDFLFYSVNGGQGFVYAQGGTVFDHIGKPILKFKKDIFMLRFVNNRVAVDTIALNYVGQFDEEWLGGDYGWTYQQYDVIITNDDKDFQKL